MKSLLYPTLWIQINVLIFRNVSCHWFTCSWSISKKYSKSLKKKKANIIKEVQVATPHTRHLKHLQEGKTFLVFTNEKKASIRVTWKFSTLAPKDGLFKRNPILTTYISMKRFSISWQTLSGGTSSTWSSVWNEESQVRQWHLNWWSINSSSMVIN